MTGGFRRKLWLVVCLVVVFVSALHPGMSERVEAQGQALSFLRESPDQSGAINPGDFKKLSDALQGKVKLVDIVNFGRLRFLSWPSRRRLSYASLDRFTDFTPLRPPATLEGFGAPVVERVAPIKVQFALKVKSLNKLLSSLGSPDLLPQELEGRTFTLATSPELRFRYPSTDLARHGDLLISETRDPVLEVPGGIDLEQVRNSLLALPLWPEPLRRQMAWVPVAEGTGAATSFSLDPVAKEEMRRVTVNGQPGIFISFAGEGFHRLPSQMVEVRRQMEREAQESGDPWMQHRARGNTLLWHQNGLLISITGENLTLAEARAVAEEMR